MAVKDVGTNWNRDTRNTIDENDKNLQRQINDLVLSSGDSNAEVVQARGGKPTLNDRLDSIEYEKASKTELSDGLATKMTRGESISVEQIDKNQGKLDETYMSEEFLQQIAGDAPIHTIPADNSITSEKLVDNSVTFNKRSRLGEIGKIMLGNDYYINDSLPNYDTTTRTLNFPYPIFIINGKDRYRIEETAINCAVGSTGMVIYFDTNTKDITCYSQTNINANENMVLIATINQKPTSQGGDVILFDISCPITINGIDLDIYFMDKIPSEKLTIPDLTSLPLITTGVNSALPNYDSENRTLNFESMNIFYRDKRYFINEPVTLDFAQHQSAGVLAYYDTETEEFLIRSQTGLVNIPPTAILIAIRYTYDGGTKNNLLINTEYTVDGKPRFMPFDGSFDETNYQFSVEKIQGDFPVSNFPAVGSSDSPFNRSTDNHQVVYGLFDDLMNNNPGYITREERGRSTYDKPIYAYHFNPEVAPVTVTTGDSPKPFPKIIMDSSIHGLENLSTDTLYYFMKRICDDWETDKTLEYLRHNVRFSIIPLPNPDDYDDRKYVGVDGINLNRDFDYLWRETSDSGSEPFSRVESVIMSDFLFDNDDALLFVNCHVRGGSQTVSDDSIMWLGSNTEKETPILTNTVQKMTRLWKKEYPQLQSVEGQLGYVTQRSTPNTVKSYAQHVVGIPTILWEGFKASTTMNDFEGQDVVNMNVRFLGETVLNVIKFYQG